MSLITWSERESIVSSWPLMSSPYPLLTIFAVYLWFVFKAGPNFMKNRKPFNLSTITRIYNVYQIVACTFFVYIGHKNGFSFKSAWRCIDDPKYSGFVDQNAMKLYHYCWYFILLRLSEFLETVFFILRKKSDQVSMLHIYHHISTVVLLWIFLLHNGGMMELFIAALNSAVHIMMYSYYFLSSFNACRKFTNSVKPFVTAIQIAQLFIIFGHAMSALLPGCKNSKLFYLQLVNAGFLISMFLKFSFDTFIKKKPSSKLD